MDIRTLPSSKIGLGTYRMSIRSAEHKQALLSALQAGCKIIDTAANYTDGEAEQLIGEVLQHNPNFSPLVITKAGYIQGTILSRLQDEKIYDSITKVSYESYDMSIDPQFLKSQISYSSSILHTDSIDLFLLHNPEKLIKENSFTKEEVYQEIEKALIFLEEQSTANVINGYGISSNTFIQSPDSPTALDFRRILEMVKQHHLNNFHAIEFPFNFLEIGAMEQYFSGQNLLQLAQEHNIRTIANRPLNAFTDQGLLRIAEYATHFPPISTEDALSFFNSAMKQVEDKYFQRLKEEEEDIKENSIWEIPFFSQFKKLWCTLPTPDAVEQVYYQHFFPLLAQIWGEEGVPPEEAEPFYALFDISLNFARQNMHAKAQIFKQQAMNAGLIEPGDSRDLALLACDSYLKMGVDFVMVGAKQVRYVEQLAKLF